MPKIYFVKSANNAVNWATTKLAIETYPMTFADGMLDFGIGAEPYTQCPGCDRNLPLIIFHLDHIKSQARYAQSNLGIRGPGDFVVLDSSVTPAADTTVTALGGTVTIKSGSIYNPKIGIVHSVEVWRNDLRNLQFLCPHCNTSKSDKDWEAWGKPDWQARPLSKIWKESTGMHL